MKSIDIEKIKKLKTTKELLKFSIINIDKPSGPTSFSVSQFIKDLVKVNKTSHLGTLDPQVSGVLPVALGRACRLNEYLMHRNKTYVGIMRLHKEVDKEKLDSTINGFIGKISQLPPKKSSVKRAYREREIIYFKILESDGKDIVFETEVQAGTYIRKLCDDIGAVIGGAHMLELRRTKAGFFQEKDSINLYDFESIWNEYNNGKDKRLREILIPGEIVATILPVIHIKKQVVKKCLTGSPLFPTFLENKEEIKNISVNDKISVFEGNNFIGCYKFIGKENLLATPEFVFN